MGGLRDFARTIRKNRGTIVGGVAGGFLGGPAGAGVGMGIGSMFNPAGPDPNAANYRAQKEFAQHGIRWKVKDAIAAGIHPLAALGASTSSFSPSFVEDNSQDRFLQMGQDITRAVGATMTDQQKQMQSLAVRSAELDIQGKELDNQYRQKQLDQIGLKGPSQPGGEYLIPGQQQSGLVEGKPLQRTTSRATSPHSEGAPISDVGWAEIDKGVFVAVPSKDLKERIEDNIFHEGAHFVRNFMRKPPDDWLRPHERWVYSGSKGGWVKSTRHNRK